MVNEQDDSNNDDSSTTLPKNCQMEPFSTDRYFQSLEKWIQEMYFIQNFNTLWYNTLLFNPANSSTSASLHLFQSRNISNARTHRRLGTLQCHLPPVWKRLAAELIDFVILFLVKILSTYTLMDLFETSPGLPKNEFDSLLSKTMKFDYEAAFELTTELVLIEVAHRVTVCLYETFWLCHGFGSIDAGSTPGKICLNLKVVHCEKITEMRSVTNEQTVYLIEPGTTLSFSRAFWRSAIKNIILAIFVPFTFMFMYFQNNRTGYDIVTQSVVIEIPRNSRNQRRD